MLKKNVPLLVSAIGGVIIVIEYFVKMPVLSTIAKEIQSWTVLISAFLLGIGMTNLLLVNIRALAAKKADILDTVVLVGGMISMFVVTAFNTQFKQAYEWLFYEIYAPLGTAVFSLLMYSMASAGFRAVRAKSLESSVFLFAAVISMLGVAPVGEVISKYIPVTYDWLLTIPNMAAQRGITVGASVGAMAVSLRVLLGIERRHIGME
jgi:bacteriorhodopsin